MQEPTQTPGLPCLSLPQAFNFQAVGAEVVSVNIIVSLVFDSELARLSFSTRSWILSKDTLGDGGGESVR